MSKDSDLILFRLFDHETFFIGICLQKELKGFIDAVNVSSPLGERIASTRASGRLIGYECYPGSHHAGKELRANYDRLLEEYKDGLLSDLVPEPPLTASEQKSLVRWRARRPVDGTGYQTLYYVYVMSTAEHGVVYVGSGTIDRYYRSKHVSDCKRPPTNICAKKSTPESRTVKRFIRACKAGKIDIFSDIVYCCTDRQDAYIEEQALINIYGIENLLNERAASRHKQPERRSAPESLPFTIGSKWKAYDASHSTIVQ